MREKIDEENGMNSSIAIETKERQSKIHHVVLGACLGSAFEWYDFFLYAVLAVDFGSLFFPKGNGTGGILASLATFGAGFVVRPLGAVVFGRVGDTIGRKKTFLLTIMIMGGATFLIGALPTFEQIGWLAPALLVSLRLLQGLAVGGEYGGAATYVAEHTPERRRGFVTAWIQTTVTGGQIMGLLVVLVCRLSMSHAAFEAWGWRLPFLLSAVLLAISVRIRLRLEESPVFVTMKAEGKGSKSPVLESLGTLTNLKMILLGLGVSAAQGVVSYSGQVYIISYLEAVLKVDKVAVMSLVGLSLALGIPMVVFIGWVSDHIGRKWLILAGCFLFATSAMPLYKAITHFANPALDEFQATTAITVNGISCHRRISFGAEVPSDCDKVREFLTRKGLNYQVKPSEDAAVVTTIGNTSVRGFSSDELQRVLQIAGYPAAAVPSRVNYAAVFAILLALTFYSSLIYAPLAAFLVEQFPARIRYTSVSISYNFGTGWFGGLAPLAISALAVKNGNIYSGFYYPIVVSAVVFVVGLVAIRGRKASH